MADSLLYTGDHVWRTADFPQHLTGSIESVEAVGRLG